MKKITLRSLRQFVFSVILYITATLFPANLSAQTATPNIRVNDLENTEARSDGFKSLIVSNDTVYVVWADQRNNGISNIFFTKSIDGGETFSTGTNICSSFSTTNHVWPTIDVENKIIYISWTAVDDQENYNIWFSKSIDDGNTFLSPVTLTSSNSAVFPSMGVHNAHVYVFYADASSYPCANYYLTRSTNGGTSFESPIQVNDAACMGSIDFDFLTSMALDENGDIYLAWIDGRRAEGMGDVFFAKSTDNGQSVSNNVMVNDINSPGADSTQYLPAITLGGPNKVYIAFTDLRLGSDNWVNNRIYLSVSENDGSSFNTESLIASYDVTCKRFDIMANSSDRLDAVLFTSLENNWGVWLLESNDGGKNFSSPNALNDTNIDSGADDICVFLTSEGNTYALWQDERLRNNNGNIYFSKISVSSNVNNTFISDIKIYPNPISTKVFIDMGATYKKISVSISNINGQLIHNEIINNSNIFSLDFNYPKGIYLVQISSDNYNLSTKVVK